MQLPGERLGGPEGNGGQHFKMNSEGNLRSSKVSLNFGGTPWPERPKPPGSSGQHVLRCTSWRSLSLCSDFLSVTHRSSDPRWSRAYLECGRHRSYRQWMDSPREKKQEFVRKTKAAPGSACYLLSNTIHSFPYPHCCPVCWAQTPLW